MITARSIAISEYFLQSQVKAKEQMREQEEKKESVLGAIKKYQAGGQGKAKRKRKKTTKVVLREELWSVRS